MDTTMIIIMVTPTRIEVMAASAAEHRGQSPTGNTGL